MNVSEPQFDVRDDAVARKLAALAHPARLRLLRHLGATDSCCVKDLTGQAGLAQSTVSQHLKVLVEADLVSFRAERQCSRYTVNAEALRELASIIGQTLDHCCGGGCCAAQDDENSNIERQADAPAA
ncbi:putative transcriptional regulator [Hoeflea sp. IMCC20628]|uniref:ArsR/SmtB family transcription factor n=1 Tax=Hoeflea sp. IMCC20628 TaxID=1620421 RepID=UPI00063BEE8D|nr:metalloregulator ArsR/SmtB family transcription factor [Hoeflea sp. IMCC20628]AKH99913.1 putative transcriptional regulator [Hoeflea sp. IMCC20628]